MVLQVRTTADLFDKPDEPATFRASLSVDDNMMLREISRTDDGNWIKVEPRLPTPVCFVRAADVVEVTNPKPVPVDLWSFVDFCTVASETFNQKQATASVGVSRDYILALALVLNGLEGKGLTDDDLQAFDPFHFTEPEWTEFCDTGGSISHYQSFDRFDPFAQIDAAVFFTFRSTSEIDRTLTNPVDPAGPYIPNSMDLFLVHMLGLTAGVKALHDRSIASSGGSIPWASFVGAGGLEALKKRYLKFLDVAGVISVDQLLDLIGSAFDNAYVNVAKIVPGALPEDLDPAGGPPKWLENAREEEAIKPSVMEPDKHIVDYFKATDFGPTATPTTSWCGAFAAFCMKSSGIPVPKGAARAANWAAWGKPLSIGTPAGKLPVGAVVVFSPMSGSGSSGHVAFFVGGDSNQVRVLGGNQHDALNETNFPRRKIAQIRWPADTTTTIPAGEIAIGPFTAADWEKYCHKLGERESNNNYASVNRLGYCGRWQFGALALGDLGYVRKGCPQRALGDSSPWIGKNHISSRDQWLDNHPEQDAAMLQYTRGHYNQLVKMRVIGPNDGKDRVAGLLAAAHLMGVGGAKDFAEGTIRHDANGTTTTAYFNLLANEFR